MMDEAAKSVQAITPTQIDEIAKYNNPPERIKNGLEALMYLLKGKKLEWEEMRAMMRNPDFTESVLKFNINNVNPKVVAHVKKEYIEKEFWNMEKLKKASKAMGPLGQWLETQINLCELMERAPEAKQLIENAKELEVLKEEVMAEEMELQDLKGQNQDAEDEKNKLQEDIDQLEAAVQSVPPPPIVMVSQMAQTDSSLLQGTFQPKQDPVYQTIINMVNYNKYYQIHDRRSPSQAQLLGHQGGQYRMEGSCQTDDFYTFEILNAWARRVKEEGVEEQQFPVEPIVIQADPILVPTPIEAKGPTDEELAARISVVNLRLATVEELERELQIRRINRHLTADGNDLSRMRPEDIKVLFTDQLEPPPAPKKGLKFRFDRHLIFARHSTPIVQPKKYEKLVDAAPKKSLMLRFDPNLIFARHSAQIHHPKQYEKSIDASRKPHALRFDSYLAFARHSTPNVHPRQYEKSIDTSQKNHALIFESYRTFTRHSTPHGQPTKHQKSIEVRIQRPALRYDSYLIFTQNSTPNVEPKEDEKFVYLESSQKEMREPEKPLGFKTASKVAAVPEEISYQPEPSDIMFTHKVAGAPEEIHQKQVTSRYPTHQICFQNANMNPAGINYEKRNNPSMIVVENKPFNVRRTVVRTPDQPMVENLPSGLVVQDSLPVVMSVTRRVTRFYSTNPRGGDEPANPAIYTGEPNMVIKQTVPRQTRVVHGEVRTEVREEVRGEVRYVQAAPVQVYESVVPVPVALPNMTYSVIEGDSGFNNGHFHPRTHITESAMSDHSTTERILVPTNQASRRVYAQTPLVSGAQIEKDVSTMSSIKLNGKMQTTTAIRFVNHPITNSNMRILPDVQMIQPKSISDLNAPLVDQSGLKLYHASSIVVPQQGFNQRHI